ncbi:hypothetical protein WJM95_22275 [Streptomyces sp. f51]|uniref:hypothetical protein n=1 Tax=Streptomyces sp. f51 TaxID=1827742 RepID=UPI0030CB9D0C
MDKRWDAGATPWLRRHQTEATSGAQARPVQCMFCGGQTLKRSMSDTPKDPGRLELYCDNQLCDAREMVLLVKRDGSDAIFRADVKALHLIDDGTLDVHAMFPPEIKSYDMVDLFNDRGNEVGRRMRKPAPPGD